MGQFFHCLRLSSLAICLLLAPLSTTSAAAAHEQRPGAELKKVKRLAKSLVRVPSTRRKSEILDEMIEIAKGHPDAAATVQQAVRETWTLAYRRANRRVFTRPFDGLAQAANELAGLRADLLSIVRDETRYPYPCSGVGASADAVHRYRIAQPEVDAAYEAIRSAVKAAPPVEMPKLLGEHLELLHWAHRARSKACDALGVSLDFEMPEGPKWLLGIPFDEASIRDGISLDEFGRSADEGIAQAYSRAIMERNRDLHREARKRARAPAARERLDSEFEQVRLTNEYRLLLGLSALQWDQKLHEA
ncbi:MAG: hypothetical protein AAGG01_14290, partial [Planctomycetota bacterium]